MEEITYYTEDIDGFDVSCPKCRKTLKEKAFFNLAIDVYRKENKLINIIQCEPNGCNYEGNLINWVGFLRHFY